jgi:hypothetical protein
MAAAALPHHEFNIHNTLDSDSYVDRVYALLLSSIHLKELGVENADIDCVHRASTLKIIAKTEEGEEGCDDGSTTDGDAVVVKTEEGGDHHQVITLN